MTPPSFTPEQLTAYHEAGHAVLARTFGWPMEPVSIYEQRASADRLAATCPEGASPSVAEKEKHLDETAMVLLAGSLAESILRGRRSCTTADLLRGDWGDFVAARRVANLRAVVGYRDDVADQERAMYLQWMAAKTMNLLRLRWGSAEALAEELLQHETLSREAVIAAIEGGWQREYYMQHVDGDWTLAKESLSMAEVSEAPVLAAS